MKNTRNSLLVGSALCLAMAQPVVAQESMVEGYFKSSDGAPVKSGSGDCVRAAYKNSTEYLEACGYERFVDKAAAVESGETGTSVTVVETAGVMKGGEVVAVTEKMIEEVVIGNVEFPFDSAELTPEYRAALDDASEALAPHRDLLRQGLASLNVIGHTDSRGAAEYNQMLSERRAQAVADYLIMQDPTREAFTNAMGRGESDPIASNDTAEGRQRNRRVVLQVIGK
jgi:outer membrane protein OmpA-like peptidoglycan-associated protein